MRLGQGRAHVAQDEMLDIGNAVRVRIDLALEHEDLALWQQLTQVVIGTAIAQTELEHRPRHPADLRSRMAEARALGLQTPNEAVETTHVMLARWLRRPSALCRHKLRVRERASERLATHMTL
jgi:hypothetical protein